VATASKTQKPDTAAHHHHHKPRKMGKRRRGMLKQGKNSGGVRMKS
jgi:hypothetical protein